MILVSHILNDKGRDVWAVGPDSPAILALHLMAEKNIGAVLVTHDDELVGVFSERDYARKVVLQGRSSKDTPVRDLMTRQVFTVSPEDTLDHCMTLMTERRIRHLPVVEEGRIAGLVTIGDVVKRVISAQAETIRSLEGYITQG